MSTQLVSSKTAAESENSSSFQVCISISNYGANKYAGTGNEPDWS